MRDDPVLARAELCALNAFPNVAMAEDAIRRLCTPARMERIIAETRTLMSKGFLRDSGRDFLLQCEKLFVHPEHADRSLAWGIRIAAKVYCPAYLALVGEIDRSEACERLFRNACEIYRYQVTRIQGPFLAYGVGRFIASDAAEQVRY